MFWNICLVFHVQAQPFKDFNEYTPLFLFPDSEYYGENVKKDLIILMFEV